MSADETREERKPKPLHGAVLLLQGRHFEQMLDLPPDVRVVAIYDDPMRAGVILHLMGDSLPEVQEYMTPQEAHVWLQEKRDDDGVWWRRMSFDIPDH